MNADQKQQLIDKLAGVMKDVLKFIQVQQIGHFYRADPQYGSCVAEGLGITLDEVVKQAA